MTESDNYLANLLGALALAIADRQRSVCDSIVGHGPAAAAALTAIAQYPGETVGFFESILGLTNSGTVRLFDRLTSAGLIDRLPGGDRRARAVSLTAKGRRLAAAVQSARRSASEELLATLSERQRSELTKATETLLAHLTDSRTGARRICRLCDHRHCDDADRCPVDHAASALGEPSYRLQALKK
jgi:MarR family transcriptional regulator, negative regulator of the multidrug operon emrRAB